MRSEDFRRYVSFVVANDRVEHEEFIHPLRAVESDGVRTVVIAPHAGDVQRYLHLDRASTVPVEVLTSAANPEDYDAVVLPGGVANPDILRRDSATHQPLRWTDERGVVTASICHGPWTLIDAELVAGRTLAGRPSLAADLTNAGATWAPERIHVKHNRITAQNDEDVNEFTAALLAALSLAP